MLVLERAEEMVKPPMRSIMVDEKLKRHIWTGCKEEQRGLQKNELGGNVASGSFGQ